MELLTWSVWDMTNGNEWKVKAEDLNDFTESGRLEQLTSFYDMFNEKWYFILRNKENRCIYQVGLAE